MRSIKQKLLWERKYANIRAALWHPVIPAKAGIQFWFATPHRPFKSALGSRFRGNDVGRRCGRDTLGGPAKAGTVSD